MAVRQARLLQMVIVTALIVTVLPAAASAQQSPEQTMLSHINAARVDAGLRSLSLNSELGIVAGRWSDSMASRNTLEHNPELARQVCGSWTRLDENVGYASSGSSMDDAIRRLHDAFMQSSGHHRNIVGDFETVGIGFTVTDKVWVTVNFAKGSPLWACDGQVSSSGAGLVARISESDPTAAAISVSRKRFGEGEARHAVLSRNDVFADSLAASPLTADGPLLFTSSASLSSTTANELTRALPGGAKVYLLGGTQAISESVADAVRARGYQVVRLGGSSRIDTALRIADQVRALNPGVSDVAVARAFGKSGNDSSAWADSVAGGAWAAAGGVPVVLSPSDKLPVAVSTWLSKAKPSRTVLFGGTAALSSSVEKAVPNPLRVGGADRAATATAIAIRLWRVPTTTERAFNIINGTHTQGWAHGLVAGGVAADEGSPILMVSNSVPATTRDLVGDCNGTVTGLLVVGDTSVVSSQVARDLEAAATRC